MSAADIEMELKNPESELNKTKNNLINQYIALLDIIHEEKNIEEFFKNREDKIAELSEAREQENKNQPLNQASPRPSTRSAQIESEMAVLYSKYQSITVKQQVAVADYVNKRIDTVEKRMDATIKDFEIHIKNNFAGDKQQELLAILQEARTLKAESDLRQPKVLDVVADSYAKANMIDKPDAMPMLYKKAIGTELQERLLQMKLKKAAPADAVIEKSIAETRAADKADPALTEHRSAMAAMRKEKQDIATSLVTLKAEQRVLPIPTANRTESAASQPSQAEDNNPNSSRRNMN